MLRSILIISLFAFTVYAQDIVCDNIPSCSPPSASPFTIVSAATDDKLVSSAGVVDAVVHNGGVYTGFNPAWTGLTGSSAVYISDGAAYTANTKKYYYKIFDIACAPTYAHVYCKTLFGSSAKLYVNGIQVRNFNLAQNSILCGLTNAATVSPVKVDRYWRVGTNIIEWEILNGGAGTEKTNSIGLLYEIRFFT